MLARILRVEKRWCATERLPERLMDALVLLANGGSTDVSFRLLLACGFWGYLRHLISILVTLNSVLSKAEHSYKP